MRIPDLFRLALAALTIAAVAVQLSLQIGAGYSVPNFFSYFTNLSNLFAAGVLIASAVGRPALDGARYVSTVNMAVVGLVFAVLLRNVDLGGLLPWVNAVLHVVMPVAVVLDWLLRPPASPILPKHLAVALVFPTAYLVYAVARGAVTGWYPYPFLNPENVGGQGVVALYALGVAATFLAVGWAAQRAGNHLSAALRGRGVR